MVAQPARVPPAAQLSQRLDGHRRAEVDAPCSRPPGRIRLRPEGHDVASGEADVVPEAPGRHGEADHRAVGRIDTPVGHRKVDGSTRPGTRGSRPSVDIEQQRDRERVPCAVGPVVGPGGTHPEGRLRGRKGMSHPDLTRLVQNQDVRIRQERQSSIHIAGPGSQSLAKFGAVGDHPCFADSPV